MYVLDFSSLINQLLNKISTEQKQIFLLGDFNINWLNYNKHQPTNEFLDSLDSQILSFHIFCSQQGLLVILKLSLIILPNVLLCEAISRNITATISDYLPQFLFAPNLFSNPLCNKSNILEKDWSKFDKENFILDYFDTNWSEILQLDQ